MRRRHGAALKEVCLQSDSQGRLHPHYHHLPHHRKSEIAMQDYPTEVREDPRTVWEATMDAKYAVAAHGFAATYYATQNKWIVFLQTLFTSGVVVGAAKQSVWLSASVGALLAIVSAYQQSAKPLAESAKHGLAKQKFSLLVAKIAKSNLELAAIETELATLNATAPEVPKAIQFAAYNDNLRTNGRPDGVLREAFSTRLVRYFV
jgi:hypothetical protein